MSSLIEGYNYDIFISYRQKDNKYDGWVTGFVENLNKELEATFKEEISVYFDINPHDGLLETHDVDESLKEKLKCLIFIPIISRTYCDPKAFAWEHEFMAFVDQASKDEFGLKVKLPNGNVASRVLPVIIHDLDVADVKQCESVLGGVMRGIEFVYKETGIDKPLSPDDDKNTNLNKTKYRLQIVKVSHAIKELVKAIENYGSTQEEVSSKVSKLPNDSHKSKKVPIVAGSAIAIILISILALLFIPKLFNPSEEIEKSIAVLPFIDDSPEEGNEYIINGLMESILNNLCKIQDLRVISRTTAENYRDNPKRITDIARELNVKYIVEGSGQKNGNNVLLTVQLIDATNDKHLWSEQYTRNADDIINLQIEVAKTITDQIKAKITPAEKERIEKTPTENSEAYNEYLLGRYLWHRKTSEDLLNSVKYYEEAIEIDSNFALAYAGLADAYNTLSNDGTIPENIQKCKEYALKAISLDYNLAEGHASLGDCASDFLWDWELAEKELKLAIELNPNFALAYRYYADFLIKVGRSSEARIMLDKVIALNHLTLNVWLSNFDLHYNEGEFENALDDCNHLNAFGVSLYTETIIRFYTYLNMGKDVEVLEEMKNLVLGYSPENSYSEDLDEIFNNTGVNGIVNWLIEFFLNNDRNNHCFDLARLYAFLEDKDKAIDCLEKEFNIGNRYNFTSIKSIYDFKTLHNDPRFISLLEKMNLADN